MAEATKRDKPDKNTPLLSKVERERRSKRLLKRKEKAKERK